MINKDNGNQELKEALRILITRLRLTNDVMDQDWIKNIIDLIETAVVKR